MKHPKLEEQYGIRIAWSEEDEGFVATAPAFPTAVCVMDTERAAQKEIRLIIKTFIEIMREDGQTVPAPDADVIDEVRRMLPIVNLSKLSKAAGINRNTMEARLRRNTPFPQKEAVKLRSALAALSIS